MGGMRISQVVAILCVVASVALLCVMHARIKADPNYRKLYLHTDEASSILAGTFYKKGMDEVPAPQLDTPLPPRLHDWRRVKARTRWAASRTQMCEMRRQKIALRRRKRI